MQFSLLTAITALAATTSAVYVPVNGTTVAPYYPTGTGSVPTGTGSPTGPAPTSSFTQTPFTGAAAGQMAGSALAMVVAGGVALML
jgi:hypothetical protein